MKNVFPNIRSRFIDSINEHDLSLERLRNELIIMILVIAMPCSFCFSQEEKSCSTKPQLIKNILNLGIIKDDMTKIETSFNWVNPTDEELEIDRIVKSCGCAEVKASKTVIPAKGELKLKVFIDVTEWQGNSGFIFTIIFKGNKIEPEYFKVIFFRPAQLRSDPKEINFGKVNDLLMTREFQVKWACDTFEDRLIVDSNIYSENNIMECKLIHQTQKKERLPNADKETIVQVLEFKANIKPDCAQGTLEDTIYIPVMYGSKKSKITVPVKGDILGPVISRPAGVVAVVTKSSIQNKSIYVTLIAQNKLIIDDLKYEITCEDKNLEVQLILPKTGNKKEILGNIKIDIKGNIKPGPIKTNIKVKIRNEDHFFDVKIPVKIIVL